MKKWIKRILLTVLAVILISAGVLACLGYRDFRKALDQEDLTGKVAELRSDPDYVQIENLPQTYLDAVVAVEDHRFREHGGVDFIAIARALKNDLLSGSMKEGGSTITQQLARNLYFDQDKELVRKVAEAFMAMELEKEYTKDEILELYVNTIYFGDGYYGIGEASRGYYRKAPAELNDYECTMLAGLPNAPSAYALSDHPDLAEQRRQVVVGQMVKYGYLSEEEGESLKEKKAVLSGIQS